MDDRNFSAEEFFSDMTQNDFKNLGVGDIGYVKRYVVSGKIAYVLHAADGKAIAVQSNQNAAVENARYRDLDLVTVH